MKHHPRDAVRRALLQLNGVLPDRPVRRTVRGVSMLLPSRHGLPYFARPGSPYGDNLVALAQAVARHETALTLLDVGANVGDSTLLVRDKVPCTAVCVEADPRWATYLHANLGPLPEVHIVPAVLVGPGTDTSHSLGVLTADLGSSIVVRDEVGATTSHAAMTTAELLELHPDLKDVRLIKSDTDGYDVMLVHAYLETFHASRPVIFFEFDPRPTRMLTPEYEPRELFARLVAAGYGTALVWDNTGKLLFGAPTGELLARSSVLDCTVRERGYGFWDIAVAHDDDSAGRSALDEVAGRVQCGRAQARASATA